MPPVPLCKAVRPAIKLVCECPLDPIPRCFTGGGPSAFVGTLEGAVESSFALGLLPPADAVDDFGRECEPEPGVCKCELRNFLRSPKGPVWDELFECREGVGDAPSLSGVPMVCGGPR